MSSGDAPAHCLPSRQLRDGATTTAISRSVSGAGARQPFSMSQRYDGETPTLRDAAAGTPRHGPHGSPRRGCRGPRSSAPHVLASTVSPRRARASRCARCRASGAPPGRHHGGLAAVEEREGRARRGPRGHPRGVRHHRGVAVQVGGWTRRVVPPALVASLHLLRRARIHPRPCRESGRRGRRARGPSLIAAPASGPGASPRSAGPRPQRLRDQPARHASRGGVVRGLRAPVMRGTRVIDALAFIASAFQRRASATAASRFAVISMRSSWRFSYAATARAASRL